MRMLTSTMGDRRTDVFVVWLLLAASLPAGLLYAVSIITTGVNLPRFSEDFLIAASDFGRLVNWLWTAADWVLQGPGVLLPIAIGVATLLRRCTLKLCVVLIGALHVLLVLARVWHEAHRLYIVGPMLVWYVGVVLQVAAFLGPAVMPLAVLGYFVWHKRANRRLRPLRSAANLTRLGLIACAALVFANGGIQAPIYALAVFVGGLAMGPYEALHVSCAALMFLWGIVLVFCARRIIAHSRMSRRVLWFAIVGDAIRWVLVSVLHVFSLNTIGALAPGSIQFTYLVITRSIALGITLPLMAVLLWYWRPVQAGRAHIALDPEEPVCGTCGYSLIGNVSGRCPECGQPVVTTEPAE